MSQSNALETLRAALEETDQLARAGEVVGYESAYRILRRVVAQVLESPAEQYVIGPDGVAYGPFDTQRAGARSDDPSAGCAESGGSDPLAATPAPQNDSTSGGPPPAVTRQWRSGEKVPASGIYATDHVRQAGDRYVAGGRQATLTRGERFPPSPFPWSLVREARHVS